MLFRSRKGGRQEAEKRVQEVRRRLELGLWGGQGRGKSQGAGRKAEGVVSQKEGQGGAWGSGLGTGRQWGGPEVGKRVTPVMHQLITHHHPEPRALGSPETTWLGGRASPGLLAGRRVELSCKVWNEMATRTS